MARVVKKKHSTEISEGAKLALYHNEGFSWREQPICDAALEKLGDDLVQWAAETNEIDIEAFFDDKNVHIRTAEKWAAKNPIFNEAFQMALQKLGTKRSKGAATFKLKDTWIKMGQHRYHKSFGDSEERASKLRQSTEEQEPDKKITVEVIHK